MPVDFIDKRPEDKSAAVMFRNTYTADTVKTKSKIIDYFYTWLMENNKGTRSQAQHETVGISGSHSKIEITITDIQDYLLGKFS